MPSVTPDGLVAVVLTVVVLLPFLAAIASRAGRTYVPFQDLAVADARVRDTWSVHLPLVGPWSRFGWSHPGPMYFWLLAIPYKLAGDRTWSLIVGGALVEGAAVVACVAVAWRRGRLAAVLVITAVLGIALAWRGANATIVPWNPYVAFPFFPLFLLLSWSVAVGDTGLTPWLVVVATFLVQTHVGYLPLVAVILACVAGFLVLDHRRHRVERTFPRHTLLWSAIVGVALWIPIVVDQVWGTRNLSRLVHYFSSPSQPAAGLHHGAGYLASEFRIPPPWLGGHDPVTVFVGTERTTRVAWLAVPILLLAVAAVLAVRRGSSATRRLVALAVVLFVIAVPALAQVRGDVMGYLILWRVFVALLVVTVFVAALAAWLRAAHGAPARVPMTLGAVVLVAITVVTSTRLAYDVATYGRLTVTETVAERMAPSLVRSAPRGEPVLVRQAGRNTLGLSLTLLGLLDRRGVAVRVDPGMGYIWGAQRTARPAHVRSVWYVAEDGLTATQLAEMPGATVVARAHVLSAAEERELGALQLRLRQQLLAVGRPDLDPYLTSPLVVFSLGRVRGIDLRALDRVGELNGIANRNGPCRCTVIAFDPALAPSSIPT